MDIICEVKTLCTDHLNFILPLSCPFVIFVDLLS